ncbi:amylo-alpha-1,6-glucosidase [Orrella sp. JC864]|uniref:amylo-alpha-1,6-glucosidase n=1 Tax=Orrella sp. JC864 TaxID=3120298 RepID=UPI00300A1074
METPLSPDAMAPGAMPLMVLKDADTFLVSDALGDLQEGDCGLFVDDTRWLSRLALRVAGQRPALLSSSVGRDNVFFTAHLSAACGQAGARPPVHVERKRFLRERRLHERIRLRNYHEQPLRVPVELFFGADFFDMFEVRGSQRPARGRMRASVAAGSRVELGYEGLDGKLRRTVLAVSQPPQQADASQLRFEAEVPPHGTWEVYLQAGPADGEPAPGRDTFRRAAAQAWLAMRRRRRRGAAVRASGRLFQAWLDRARGDIALLTTELPTGPYPYAGIPWFSTPFGRDAVITALQMLWLDPALARGVLAYLAEHQAREQSAFRDAEPGKIMHETRKGEMSALGELPFARYYGGVDTTPLFIILAAAYLRRTGDADLVARIRPALWQAAQWLDENAARSPLGLVTYARAQATGLANQGWKDSHDSVFHADGTGADGPIALVEVQGYAYRAWLDMAELAQRAGQPEAARRWREQARRLRATVEARFWLPEQSYYALAVDGLGRACRVRASNAGHLLYCGLPSAERAKSLIAGLCSRGLYSGWGIRTLATEAARYDPMSYHNGSVWPHDVALCALGMSRYGERAAVARLLQAMFEAAAHFSMRLPELFCGLPRAAAEAPVRYPVACLPQAWASGAAYMLLQASLGLDIRAQDPASGRPGSILIERPQLPVGMDRLEIRRLAVGGHAVNLVFQRTSGQVVVWTDTPPGDGAPAVDVRLN